VKKSLIFILIGINVLALSAFAPGCGKVIEQMKPEIRGTTLEWGAVTSETTEIIGTIKVYNPNSISLTVKKIAYTISMDGINVGSAESPGLEIPKEAEFSLQISAKIDNSKIPAFWSEHIKRNEQSEITIEIRPTFDLKVTDFTFPFKINRTFETDLLASLNKVGPIPIEQKATLPFLGETTIFKATLESLSGKWGAVMAQSTQINLSAVIFNENPYPLVVPTMEYKMDMNGVPVGSGEAQMQFVCEPNARGELNLTADLDTSQMGKWFASHIQQGEKSTFNMSVSLVFDIPMYGRYSMPIWEGSQSFQTDMLGGVNSY
jgi:LEA14-like dessication related protein